MPANESRKYTNVVNRVEDIIGADIANDRLKMALVAQELQSLTIDTAAGDPLAANITDIGGQPQSAVDVASRIDSIFAALQSQAGDELRARVFNSSGTAIDPATAALEGALKSEDTDELVSRVAGADGIEVQEEALNTGVAATDVGLLTYLARALNSQDLDEFITRVTDSTGTQIDPATAALEGALKSEDTDELVSRVAGSDGLEVQEEALDTAVNATDVSILTYLARALNSQDLDEFITRVTDSTGTQINPLTQAPLQSVANDELRSRLFAPDAGGTLQQVNAEQFDTALGATDVGVATYLARALNDLGQDELVSRLTDSTGTQIDPATAALEGALKSEDTDELVSRVTGADGLEVQEEALDTAVNTTDVGLLTYLARALNDVGQDELVSRLTDSTGTQINPDQSPDYPDSQTIQHDLDPNAAGDLVVGPVSVARSQAILIAADSTDDQNWSASVDWEDGSGNVFQTESATDIGLSGVDNESARLNRKGPQVEVTFTSDAAAGTQNLINAYVDVHR